MNNILQQIYNTSVENNQQLNAINNSLAQLLANETAEFKSDEKFRKEEQKIRKREAQMAKRKAGDKKGLFETMPKKKQEKEKKSIGQVLLEALGAVGSSIMGILGGLGNMVGGMLASALGGLGIGAMITTALSAMGPALIIAVKAAAIAAATGALLKTGSTVKGGIYRQTGGVQKTKKGVGFDLQDINQLKEKHLKFQNETFGKLQGEGLKQFQRYEDLEEAMRSAKAANDRIYNNEQEIARLRTEGRPGYQNQVKTLQKQIAKDQKQKADQTKLATKLYADLKISEKDLIQHQIDHGRRNIDNLPQGYKKEDFKERDLGTGFTSQFEFNTYNDEAPLKKQEGGRIPTLLEPGEKVFSPGEWNAGIEALNNLIPRFQTGGKVDDKAGSKVDGEKENYKPGEVKSKEIKPGGYINFIGDGSGFTGELKFFGQDGKHVGSYGGISGVARSAGSTQEQRANQPGAYNPLPDGTYALESPMGPGSAKVGSFAAWINNPSGTIGRRGEIFLHNDIGSDGTQGCVGVELGGARGPNANTKKFIELYDKVMPRTISVNLQDSSGKKFGPGDVGSASGANGFMQSVGQSAEGMLRNLGGFGGLIAGLGEGLGELFGADGMNLLQGGWQALVGAGAGAGGFVTGGFGALMSMFGGGDAGATNTGGNNAGNAGAGAVSINDPNGRAILNAIADAEGTSGYPNNGYNTQFTGRQFSGTQHPRQVIKSGQYGSDAAGRYQFLSTTWDSYANGRDMSPANQDAVALDLVAKKRNVDLSDGLSKAEVYRIGQEWASVEGGPQGIPGGSYSGQAKYSADKFLQMYENYGGTVQRQQGGRVGRSASYGNKAASVKQAQEEFAQMIASAVDSDPIVVYEDPPQSGNTTIAQGAPHQMAPTLPNGPSSIQAAEYFYNLSLGGTLS